MIPVHAHKALLELEPGADPAAPGAAVTVELCGDWRHAGTCRWPHRVSVIALGERLLGARILYAAEPGEADAVRARIVAGLARGELTGPDGRRSRWLVRRERSSRVVERERALAGELSRLAAAGGAALPDR